MSEKTCKTCRFWDDRRGWDSPELDPAKGVLIDYRVGVCRIRAPVCGGFPTTRHYDWCGEHQSHPKDTPHE